MELLRKYGAATTIYFPLVTAGAQDYKATPTIATGDCMIDKDAGGFNNVGTAPAETAASSKLCALALTAAEMQAASVTIRMVDQTATKEWEDQMILISTYGHASARHPFDLGIGAIPELTVDAGATPTIFQAIMRLYMEARNAKALTNTNKAIKNSAGTAIVNKTLADDGTTYSETKDTNS